MPIRNPSVSNVFYQKLFSDDQCDKILASLDDEFWGNPLVRDQEENGKSAKNAIAHYFQQQRLPVQQNGYPLDMICSHVCAFNSSGWKFAVSGVVGDDFPSILRYQDHQAGLEDWHSDVGPGIDASRKLGFCLQLTQENNYDGGDLEFHNVSIDRTALRERGTLIVYPSYWLHRCTPVTRGKRYAVIGRMHGDSFV